LDIRSRFENGKYATPVVGPLDFVTFPGCSINGGGAAVADTAPKLKADLLNFINGWKAI
jgi:hypothetical protein